MRLQSFDYTFPLTTPQLFTTMEWGDFMAILLILATLLYSSLGSVTVDNFTVIGNTKGNLIYFIVWTFFIATYFLLNSKKICEKFHFTFRYQKLISSYIYFACIITPFIPYTEKNVFLDDLHVFLAFSSATLFLFVWLLLLGHLKNHFPEVTRKIELPFLLMVHTLGLCLVYFGIINSIIELIIIISIILLIEFLKKI